MVGDDGWRRRSEHLHKLQLLLGVGSDEHLPDMVQGPGEGNESVSVLSDQSASFEWWEPQQALPLKTTEKDQEEEEINASLQILHKKKEEQKQKKMVFFGLIYSQLASAKVKFFFKIPPLYKMFSLPNWKV